MILVLDPYPELLIQHLPQNLPIKGVTSAELAIPELRKNYALLVIGTSIDRGSRAKITAFLEQNKIPTKICEYTGHVEELMLAGADERLTFYGKIFEWIRDRKETGPLLVGINGSQGIGKSTLCSSLVNAFAMKRFKALSLSIDDFYYTRAQQVALAKTHANNPLLQERGYAGTHDIELGTKILNALKSGASGLIPVYDKSAHGGKGDRAPEENWQKVDEPVDIILFDGWMLGHKAVDRASLKNPNLIEINDMLPAYDQWLSLLDAFVILAPEKPEYVLHWRVEAEERMRAAGRGGMPSGVIEDYVKSFMPAYETYLPGLLKNDPIPSATLRFVIKKDRLPA